MAQIVLPAAFVPPARPEANAPVHAVPSAQASVRLTRRGRFLLIGLPVLLGATALLVLLGVFTAPVMAAGTGEATPVLADTVTVSEGETLWGLAAEFAPNRDPREVISEIAELNNLAGSKLVPGQELFVPTGD